MSFFDKAKAAASQAAAKAKQSASDVQAKVDLGSAYDDLGKVAYELIESGAIAHEQLEAPAAKVRELRERIEGGADAEPEPEPAEVEAESAAPAPGEPESEPAPAQVEPESAAPAPGEPEPAPDVPPAG